MNFVLFVARRYLLAKKNHNVINIITWISIAAMAVGTAGFVIVLSVFNGFGNLVLSLYDAFDADIKVTPAKGKYFVVDSTQMAKIKSVEGITAVWPVVEDNAMLRYRDKQMIARVKGVDSEFADKTAMQHYMIDGKFILRNEGTNYIVLGGGVAYDLGLRLKVPDNIVSVFYPDENAQSLTELEAFRHMTAVPNGVFGLQQDFDNKYVFVPLEFARELFGKNKEVSQLEIMLSAGQEADKIKQKIAAILPQCQLQSRAEQHGFLYKILITEKFVAYLILVLILLIATFSILGALTMLIIEKKKDINVLFAMGCSLPVIKKIFFTEGLMITLIGAALGLATGAVICTIQQLTGVVKLGAADSFVTDAYPVAMLWTDFAVTFFIVCCIGFAASAYIALKLIKGNALEVHYLNNANG